MAVDRKSKNLRRVRRAQARDARHQAGVQSKGEKKRG